MRTHLSYVSASVSWQVDVPFVQKWKNKVSCFGPCQPRVGAGLWRAGVGGQDPLHRDETCKR